jgi:putative phosphoserine phosphatase/1-acylglycerol-3-phosphate O-acyltransferase
VLASLCPPGALVLYKKEFEKVPGLGHALHSLGMIPVDRENLEAAVASVAEAARRIKEEGATCMIAPEGTRSRKGGLQKFKMGAFHLASEYGIPIVPMIMRGIDRVLPMGCLIVRSGVVRVDFLEPIDTSEWDRERLREHSREVRALFLEYLPSEKELARGE